MEWNSLHCEPDPLTCAREDEQITTHLCFNCIPTLLAEIHEIQYTTFQMRQRRDALHLDRVHVF